MPVVECDVDEARAALAAEGASIDPGNTRHERWRATLGGAHAVAYRDKVVVQGADPRRIEALLADGGGRVHLYYDGASRGNPGPAAIGWVLVSGDGIVAEGSDRIGRATNNQAEYAALIAGLEAASEYGFDEIHIRGDSELVEKQLRGSWETRDPVLQERRVTALEILQGFEDWTVTHVPRSANERADRLANDAFDE